MPDWNKSKLSRIYFYQKVFLTIANSTDYVVMNGRIPQELQDHWLDRKWEFGLPISLINKNLPFIDSEAELIEFGKVHSLVAGEFNLDENIWRSSAFLNSKVEQAKFSKLISYGDEIIKIAYSPEDIIEFAESTKCPIIIKEALSNSGSGHVVWQSAKENYKLNRIPYPAVMEVYQVNRILDFGILIHVSRGQIELLDIAEMLIGKDFNYKGSFYYPSEKPQWYSKVKKLYNEIYPFAESWQKFIESENYEGPISIDGFLSEDGRQRLRSEINFRYTMGRIGYEIMLKRKLSKDWLQNIPKQTGIVILHSNQKIDPRPDYELILSFNENDPWKIVYIEYRDQICRSIH